MIQAPKLPLCEVLDSSLFAEAFQEDKVVFGIADEDVFNPAITLWAMVSQFLYKQEGRSCKAAAGRVVSLLAQITGRVVAQNAGNYCRAKAKIPIATIKKITLRLASQAEIGCLEFDDLTAAIDSDQAEERLSPRVIAKIRAVPIKGRIIMVDGFTIDAPDTAENQAEYPQSPAQEEGLGFPILRCVCLISMVTGMLLDLGYAAYSGKGTGETAILRQMRSSLRTGDIVVADSYHCTYWFIAMCMKIGVHVVMKNHHKRDDDPIGAKRYSDTERTIKWARTMRPKWMSKKEYRGVPEFIEMRLSDVVVDTPGSRTEGFTVATTMLDRESHSGACLRGCFARECRSLGSWVRRLKNQRWRPNDCNLHAGTHRLTRCWPTRLLTLFNSHRRTAIISSKPQR